MSNQNPYAAPEVEADKGIRLFEPLAGMGWIRAIFYSHLVAIVDSAVVVLADTNQRRVPGLILIPMVILALLALYGCPIGMGVVAFRLKDRSAIFRCITFAADVCLTGFQVWVLVPLIQ